MSVKNINRGLKKILLFIIVVTSFNSWSQNGFNYKAIIKDDLGNVVSNQSVDLIIRILENSTLVYQESHSLNTDNNGLIVLAIGNGTTNDNFSAIDWSSQNHNLNIKINTGNGFVDIGTTAFKAVPYASYADNVSGLEELDEGNGNGYRLIGRNPNLYSNIGLNAIDLSSVNVGSSGSFGASGNYASAFGNNTLALGHFSTSLGYNTKAESYGSTAIGRYNIGGGNSENLTTTDPLFEVGNGTSLTRKNALTILHNGKVGIGNHQPQGYLEVKVVNSVSQPNLNLIHNGTTGARINFSNTDTTNGNVWTLYGDSNDIDANSVFNVYHNNAGNILQVKGNGTVRVKGDLTVTNTTKIGTDGVAISEIIKITGIGDQSGNTYIDYPTGYDWNNTYVLSCKVKSSVGGGQAVNWYTNAGNYTAGDDTSVYVNLLNNQFNKILLKASDSQYIATEYTLILMKIN